MSNVLSELGSQLKRALLSQEDKFLLKLGIIDDDKNPTEKGIALALEELFSEKKDIILEKLKPLNRKDK